MSDVILVQQKIQEKITLMERERPKLDTLAREKAVYAANYDKAIAITIMKLNAGKVMDIEGETIKDPAKSIMEKLAKGICYQERLDMDVAEANYKSQVQKLDCVKAELNGYQSINRHLDTT